MPAIVVQIEWDTPDDPHWLNADNVALALHAYCKNTRFVVQEAAKPPEPWIVLRATPQHRSVICEDCGITPQKAPGPGWRRRGTDPKTWRHLCPMCAAGRF